MPLGPSTDLAIIGTGVVDLVVPGLYLIGEILDCDVRIGGFNFPWAWATGYLAGRAVALCSRLNTCWSVSSIWSIRSVWFFG
jgi:hypothetical protein